MVTTHWHVHKLQRFEIRPLDANGNEGELKGTGAKTGFIEYDLLPGPRIYGHETAGTVAAVGAGVTNFEVGDRVIAFHHIPCSDCFYCARKLYAQCAVYKRVGITAGYEAAGGGFARRQAGVDHLSSPS